MPYKDSLNTQTAKLSTIKEDSDYV